MVNTKPIAIIIIYSYLILSYFKMFDLNKHLFVVSFIILAWTVYNEWRIYGKDNPNSFEYLYKNNKKEFVYRLLIVFAWISCLIMC